MAEGTKVPNEIKYSKELKNRIFSSFRGSLESILLQEEVMQVINSSSIQVVDCTPSFQSGAIK